MIPKQLEIREQDGRLYAVNDGIKGVHYTRYTNIGAVLPYILSGVGSILTFAVVVYLLVDGSITPNNPATTAIAVTAVIVLYLLAVVLLRAFSVGKKITSHFIDKAVSVMYTAPFYVHPPDGTASAQDIRRVLVVAMESDEYRVRARTIIDAGIMGFSRAATSAGERDISGQIATRTLALRATILESDQWRDREASDMTDLYLRGLDD